MNFYHPETVYKLDRAATSLDKLSSIDLMGLAGRRFWNKAYEQWPDVVSICVFVGPGNNGGDGFVVALEAAKTGIQVQLHSFGDLSRNSESANYYQQLCLDQGLIPQPWDNQQIETDLIVDALLGIGLTRELDSQWQNLITAINHSDTPVASVDIPSGLNAEFGVAQPTAIKADLTMTFIAAKLGQVLASGPDYCGHLVLEDLGISKAVKKSQQPALLDARHFFRLPPKRHKNSHKNSFGHVFVVGGEAGMNGAVLLAGHAALRTGAGLVTCFTDSGAQAEGSNSIAELMFKDWSKLEAMLSLASVIAIGPGLTESAATRHLLKLVSQSCCPLVIDAGALTAEWLRSIKGRDGIITPHPGEAGRLLGLGSGEIQTNRIEVAQKLELEFGKVSVLKGNATLIATDDRKLPVLINQTGNSGLASAGTGDVLVGIIAALRAQGLNSVAAAASGANIHGQCADHFCHKHHEAGLIASDIIENIPDVMKQEVVEVC